MDSATATPPATPPALLSALRRIRWGRPAPWGPHLAIAAASAGLAVAVVAVSRRSRPPDARPLPVSVVTAQPVSQYLTSRDYTG